MKTHQYQLKLTWTGNLGKGTRNYTAYSRNHHISKRDKPDLLLSADTAFRGDADRYNPEELLLASLSSCHMLWYLHLCSTHHIVVIHYDDEPAGTMIENTNGSGQFSQVVLFPTVIIDKKEHLELAHRLHRQAHNYCFIARSVNFSVQCEPTVKYMSEPEKN